MNTPTQRRATRLLCTATVMLGTAILIGAVIAAARGNTSAMDYAVLAVITVSFALVALVETNQAAKR